MSKVVQTLSDPFNIKWPTISDDIDKEIQSKLRIIFHKYKSCLRVIKKAKKGSNKEVDTLSEEEMEKKKLFKSSYMVGMQCVMKHLERDELRLVLMWRATQPPLLRTALLSLVVSQQCPSVCLSDLLTPVQDAWPGLTSLTAIGIKKTDVANDFDDLVNYVTSTVPPIDLPDIPSFQHFKSELKSNVKQDSSDTAQASGDAKCSLNVEQSIENSEIFKNNKTEEKVFRSNANKDNVALVTSRTAVKLAPPSVDPTKYYVYKTENATKAFDGQDFIGFGEDKNAVVDIVGGAVVNEHQKGSDKLSYGIATSLLTSEANVENTGSSGQGKSHKLRHAGKKRKNETKSGYIGINIKQFKRDPANSKSKKVKKVRQKKQNRK